MPARRRESTGRTTCLSWRRTNGTMAEHLWQGSEPCTEEQCEAGFTSGDLVISVEHSKGWSRVLAGFRNCAPVAFSEIETSKGRDAIREARSRSRFRRS